MKPPKVHSLHVLSDSTASLARHMLGAFLTQFPPDTFSVRIEPFVRTMPKLQAAMTRAKDAKAAVCHAMVADEFKLYIADFCKDAKLPCCDLTGGIMQFLSKASGLSPHPNVEALHRVDEAYAHRIGALEFTVSHDDGLGL